MPNPSGPMACPVDGTTLTMSERSGIEIDYCPACRGVWLDRGELDKIIERNADAGGPPEPPQPPHAPQTPQPPQAPWGQQGYGDPRGDPRGYGHRPPRRRKSFLEELFD